MPGPRSKWFEPLIYGSVCVLLWFVPVFDRLHVESAAVVTFAAFFVSGATVIRRTEDAGRAVRWMPLVAGRIGWLAVPALLLTVSSLWAPNCDWIRGAGLFAAFTIPTVLFSAGLGLFFVARSERPLRWLVVTGLVLAILGPIFDIGFHPQFYTYSTVFGGVLGPIYDEDLVIRSGFFVHRLVTVAWGLFFLVSSTRFTEWSLVLVLGIGGAYVFSGPLGLNTPAGYLQSTFDGRLHTEHFDIHYDETATDSLELVRIAEEHEFRYAQLSRALGTEVPDRIITYIYPDAGARARHTGARVTSVAPVWLRTPQIHVERATFFSVFPHELVHVFSREFGLPLLNASIHVGLVEGLAVALEPPDGGPTPDEQVAAAAWSRAREGTEDFSVANRMAAALSPAGFWGGRGAVSYTTSGSFVGYLLRTYGPEALTAAYPIGDFEAAYGEDVGVLAGRWERGLQRMPVMCRTAGPRAARRFAVPSLFERRCPHWVPPELRTLRQASRAARDGRDREALSLLAELPGDVRSSASVRLFEADLVVESDPSAALRLLGDSLVAESAAAAALAADAHALLGRPSRARALYSDAISLESPVDRSVRTSRILRRALADRPEAVRAVRAAGSDAAVVLPSDETGPAAALADAIILYGLGRFDDALDRLAGMPEQADPLWPTGEAERYALRLEALSLYRTGRFDTALAAARLAAEQYAGIGDASMATVMEDLAARIEWRMTW